MQKHVNIVDLVKSFPTNIFLQIWRRYSKERALYNLIIWMKNQGKARYRTFQLRRFGDRKIGKIDEVLTLRKFCFYKYSYKTRPGGPMERISGFAHNCVDQKRVTCQLEKNVSSRIARYWKVERVEDCDRFRLA